MGGEDGGEGGRCKVQAIVLVGWLVRGQKDRNLIE